MSEPRFVAETLAWCNEKRAEKGSPALDRLPRGRRADSRSCPCGAATGLCVGYSKYGDNPRALDCELPHAVGEFALDFDRGNLPQYDEEAIGS